MEHWNELPQLATTIANDHLFVVVSARKGTISYKNALERLPDELRRHFSGINLMIIFPDQYDGDTDVITVANPQIPLSDSPYEDIREWIKGIPRPLQPEGE